MKLLISLALLLVMGMVGIGCNSGSEPQAESKPPGDYVDTRQGEQPPTTATGHTKTRRGQ